MSNQDNQPRTRAPRRVREINASANQNMLEDHPFLIPAITVLIAGFCSYATVFSHLASDIALGANPDPSQAKNFNAIDGWTGGIALAILFVGIILLLVSAVSHTIKMSKRQPLTCPQCKTTEPRPGAFARTRVKDTAWEEVTCPNCGNKWYSKA